jgi:hypothetical protein
MGEAKRRKAILGGRYGTSETSKREEHRLKSKTDLPIPDKLMPDYGTYYMKTMGITPLNAWIANPQVITGGTEANINWNAGGYLATLIVTPEFAEAYKRNPSLSYLENMAFVEVARFLRRAIRRSGLKRAIAILPSR